MPRGSEKTSSVWANTGNGQSPFNVVDKRGINGGSQNFELTAATAVPMMSLSAAMVALLPSIPPIEEEPNHLRRRIRTTRVRIRSRGMAAGPGMAGTVHQPYSTAGPAAGSVTMLLV
ncbi:hypothetical protein I6F15_29045 [Bradyrhizobium sp. BRP14]|nr:hypothetical protein [Bradyrhizobium sp. BRP14]